MRHRLGFTLVELLVVIGVLALLIALLLPSLGQARYRARSVICGSNQRQVFAVMTTYAVDNRNYYPASNRYGMRQFTATLARRDFWANVGGVDVLVNPGGSIIPLIWPSYIRDMNGVFKCPLVLEPDAMNQNLNTTADNGISTHYTMYYGTSAGPTSKHRITRPMLRIGETFAINGREYVTFMSDFIQSQGVSGIHFYVNHTPEGGPYMQSHFTELDFTVNGYQAEYGEGNFVSTDGSVIRLSMTNAAMGDQLAFESQFNLPLSHRR